MIQLLLDQGLPLRSAAMLRQQNLDVVHVHELGMSAAPDEEILAFALEHHKTCITLDHDFHKLLALSNATKPSVILIRAQRLNHEEATKLISRIIAKLDPALFENGVAITATRHALRIHPLPLRAVRKPVD